MILTSAIISTVLFFTGILVYWTASRPLKDLPNWHQLQAWRQKKS